MVKKISLFIFLLGALLSYTSCSQIDLKYKPTNNAISFANDKGSYTVKGEDIKIQLSRGNLDGDFTVKLNLTGDSNFSLESSSVSFKNGEGTAIATIKYDFAKLKPGLIYKFNIKIDDSQKGELSPAAYSEYNGSASMPLEYEDYAEMSYSKPGFLGSMVKGSNFKLQRAKYTKTYYRFIGLFNSTTNFDFVVNLATGEISDVNLKLGSLGTGDAFTVYMFPTGLQVDNTAITAYPRVMYTFWDTETGLNPEGIKAGDVFYSNMWAAVGDSFANSGKSFNEFFTVTKLL